MEEISGLKSSTLPIRPIPLLKYRELNDMSEARVLESVKVEAVHKLLEEMLRELPGENELRGKRGQRMQRAKANVSPITSL